MGASGKEETAPTWLKGCVHEVDVEEAFGRAILEQEGTLTESEKLFESALDDDRARVEDCELSFSLSESDDDEDFDTDDDDFGETQGEAEERKQALRGQLIYLVRAEFAADSSYLSKPLSALNREAASRQKSGEDMAAIASYAKLFAKVQKKRLTHPELYVTHCNRAQAYLNLELYEEALFDAMSALRLAEASLNKTGTGREIYIKAHAKKGLALLGLKCFRQASDVFDTGLKLDPFHQIMKAGLEESQRKILEDLLSGKTLGVKALPSSNLNKDLNSLKITQQPYSAPLFKIRNDDMVPRQLLTPFQAENDYHVKDNYNYMTVQGDTRMPKIHLSYLEDDRRHRLYRRAIASAVAEISNERDLDCRVLNLGCGSGLNAMLCLEAGAVHVTCVDRWLYLAMSAKEVLLANGYTDDDAKVVYKRPTDLALIRDVPVACNLLVCDILDDGLLTSGLIPAISHALDHLTITKPVVIPCSATVYVQAGEVCTKDILGLDLSSMNKHRWLPTFTSGLPVDEDQFIPLSKPIEVWQFDLLMPPEEAQVKTMDLAFSRDGTFNAVRFWYELHLFGDVRLSTGPVSSTSSSSRLKSLRPAVQYLRGQLAAREGDVMPLVCEHNTVRIRFDLEDAEYSSLTTPDATFPPIQFNFLADHNRNEAYCLAIDRVVTKMKSEGKECHALDMGAGSALLAMMAARSGADSVVACDIHGSLCQTARHVIARNNLSSRVTVVNRDVGLIERGTDVRTGGVNLVLADFFDCGLLKDNFLFLLEKLRKNVMTKDCLVVPAAATVYCMGIESHTDRVQGFDLSAVNKYRWDKDYECCKLSQLKHRRLTKPKKVFEYYFQGDKKGRSRENVVKLEVVEKGVLNAIVFWFDLHLDEEETITSAPFGIETGGKLSSHVEAFMDPEDAEEAGAPGEGDVEGEGEGEGDGDGDGFVPSATFGGSRAGWCFKLGPRGQGYYPDSGSSTVEAARARSAKHHQIQSAVDLESDPSDDEDGDCGSDHHWGQALQYLERSLFVDPKKTKRVTLLAKRDGNVIRFSLKQGVGTRVGKSPWKVEWGGGASVENPHYQRVHYCQLLINDFLMRLRSKRFPPIEGDMKMMVANCGNLFLDPGVVTEIYHELVCLEMIHSFAEFCPGASLEAITKRPLAYQ